MIVSVSDLRQEAREIIEKTMTELFPEGKNKVMNKAEAVNFLNRLCMKPRYPCLGRYWDPREDIFAHREATMIGLSADYFAEHTAYIWENQSQKKVS